MTIYKYPLTLIEKGDGIALAEFLPKHVCEIKKVAIQNREWFVWCEVNLDKPSKSSRTLYIIGTGRPVPYGKNYLDSVFDRVYVWHIYV